jgi:hypothetical protein
LVEEALYARGGTEVSSETAQFRAGYTLLNGLEGSVDAGLRAAVNDDLGAFRGERGGNCQADTGGRARHYSELSLQSEVHRVSL